MKKIRNVGLSIILAFVLSITLNTTDVKAEGGYTGLTIYNGNWCYLEQGEFSNYTGLVYDPNVGWWYVENGVINFGYDGLIEYGGAWWCVDDGRVVFDYSGLWCDPNVGWWYVENGVINFNYDGLIEYGGAWWCVDDGRVVFGYSGLWCDPNVGWWYVENGVINFGYDGLIEYGGAWWCVDDGRVVFDYSGLWCDPNVGWWLVNNGVVAFEYTGSYYDAAYGNWYVCNGAVDFSVNVNSRSFKVKNPVSSFDCDFGDQKVVMNVSSKDGVADEVNRLMNEYYFSEFEIHMSNPNDFMPMFDEISNMVESLTNDINNWYWQGAGFHMETSGGNTIFIQTNSVSTREKLVVVFDCADQIFSSISANTTENYIRQINDFLVDTCDYDYDFVHGVTDSWSAYACLINHKAVCEGYARSFKLFMDMKGIECRYVPCVVNVEGHMFNVVKVDGAWYIIDTTWNDTCGSRYYYYLLGSEDYSSPENQASVIKSITGVDISYNNYPCSR